VIPYLKLMRPRQVSKNALCLAGVLFSEKFGDAASVEAAFQTFIAFCAGSSAIYIVNDIVDRDRDRAHPTKRFRPIASSSVNVGVAAFLSLVLAAVALGMTALLGPAVLICLAFYLANSILHSLWLKHVALLDVLGIATGFVLRLLAGVYAVDDVPTTWITLCTFFLAVFLAFAKRRAELDTATDGNGKVEQQRPVLNEYSVHFLDHLVNSSALMAVMCYALFTTTPTKNPSLVITVPVVYYAIMHYHRMVMTFKIGQEPEEVLLRDFRLQLSILLWLVLYFGISLSHVHWFR
jgi:4-hydroxybenzoate polyprenyltransferase